jgi:hypothetical protein
VTLLVFLVWSAVVLIWYFTYGIKHSHLGRHEHVGLIHDPAHPSADQDAGDDIGKGSSSHA